MSNGELDDLLADEEVSFKTPSWAPPPPVELRYEIESYLRSAWGNEVYEGSAFAELARNELAREDTVRARPKKGK